MPQPTRVVPALLRWFGRNARDLPWRRTRDPYAIWISEIMLQQTQVKAALPYWERWMQSLPDIASLAAAAPEKVLKLWEGLGYYRRVRHLHQAAQVLRDDHGGVFPKALDRVLALPGIGRYTAGAICSMAFNQPAPILDGNVIRVLTRLHGIRQCVKTAAVQKKLWNLAQGLVTEAARLETTSKPSRLRIPHCSHLNQALMELGALVCTPREPCCPRCPLETICAARTGGRVDKIPNLGKRAATLSRHFIALILRQRGRLLVRQRPAETVNGHLWEFPNFEIADPPSSPAPSKPAPGKVHGNGNSEAARLGHLRTLVRDQLGWDVQGLAPLGQIKHSITRYRMTVDAYLARPAGGSLKVGGEYRWVDVKSAETLAFTSAHRKLLSRVGGIVRA